MACGAEAQFCGNLHMKGHGERLSRKQSAAIAALLVERTVKAAAKRAGVHEATLRNWIAFPPFAEAFRRAADAVMAGAANRLQAMTDRAADVLGQGLYASRPADRLDAAKILFGHVTRLTELLNFGERVERLEATLARVTGTETPPVGVNGAVH
jgi:hypothetical protein